MVTIKDRTSNSPDGGGIGKGTWRAAKAAGQGLSPDLGSGYKAVHLIYNQAGLLCSSLYLCYFYLATTKNLNEMIQNTEAL